MPPSKADIESIVKTAEKGSPFRRRLTWFVVLLALLGGGWYWWSAASRQSLPAYVTETVGKTDIVVQVTATGTVQPTGQVEISSELSGTVRSVEADFNDVVKKGQILARLDTDKLEANVELGQASLTASQARLAEATATLNETKDNYDRAVMLEQKKVTTLEGLLKAKAAHDRAKAAVKSAEADIRVSEANLRISEANLAKACICSSIDGVVLDRTIEVGQIVASSLQAPVLFTLAADLTKMELRVDIDEADIGMVKVGHEASFSVEAYQGRSFPAVISQLRFAPKTVDGVVTYEAILSIDNADMLLRPGMTATADIKVAEVKDTLAISNAALRFSPPVTAEDSGGSGSGLLGMIFRPPTRDVATAPKVSTDGHRDIWLLKNGQAVAVSVMPGESDGSKTAISSGDVTEGDLVITDQTTQ
ncbi:MAG: efflux RND transporter periplasmic adaptor subunit [Hoeflea sp.]|uniref:efflux RND transporter periplasmic adaptor subunit n=1 Tax=Hoeflea sp. TaxID=1940281 RepID=UPI001D5AF360|nr:efflux RND transporter periplasmic adaptor subunit [Hoeflea sp.]MBU4530101.1 efflux RND transporter periplasmic adaptor subunit [Alphaproteobacteria bacterium]MBU4542614.1 efflux RND transporter periplasmic adaptor subunit [Alphaproteobacteria bacterium]MBU4551295.1 efflux RND transporter periplasmic adaptor subunit [Alphaproteobacteria bacterium]MBV1723118.1 efflux RND transporter periplasmic adaptor subunit [Hoeflea sp.]MBV1760129.1 efflux RND transporter periplasmic adaptor subunit [Hoef